MSQAVMVSRKHQDMWQEVQNLQPRKPMTRLVADELEKAHLSEFQELSKSYAGGHIDGDAPLAPHDILMIYVHRFALIQDIVRDRGCDVQQQLA
jgi:hypothetical protein